MKMRFGPGTSISAGATISDAGSATMHRLRPGDTEGVGFDRPDGAVRSRCVEAEDVITGGELGGWECGRHSSRGGGGCSRAGDLAVADELDSRAVSNGGRSFGVVEVETNLFDVA